MEFGNLEIWKFGNGFNQLGSWAAWQLGSWAAMMRLILKIPIPASNQQN
jgi:hypothetical protein